MLTPDSIVPDPTNPQSLNRYSYSYNNPINLVDPSGHCAGNPNAQDPSEVGSDFDGECWQRAYQIQDTFGVDINFLGEFETHELLLIVEALNKTHDNLGAELQQELISQLNQYSGQSDFINWLQDRGSWDSFGIHIGGGGLLTPLGASGGIDFVFNFESLEFSAFLGGGINIGVGLSIGGEGYAFFGFNTPSSGSLAGGYYAGGASGSLGPIAAGGFVGHSGILDDSGIDLPSQGDPYYVAVGWAPGFGAQASGEIGYAVEIFRLSYNSQTPSNSTISKYMPWLYYLYTWTR